MRNGSPASPFCSQILVAHAKHSYQNKIDEESDSTEKFQKIRKIDSPTELNNKNSFQFPSFQYVNVPHSKKLSPQPEKRSISPKTLYPPSIQKFLKGKSQFTIDQTIDRLKTPSQKNFKTLFEQMRLAGQFQEQEIETHIVLRRAYSHSPNRLLPIYQSSPVRSPVMLVPSEKDFLFQNKKKNSPRNHNINFMRSSPRMACFKERVMNQLYNFDKNSNQSNQDDLELLKTNDSINNSTFIPNLQNDKNLQELNTQNLEKQNFSDSCESERHKAKSKLSQRDMSSRSQSPLEETRDRTVSFLITDEMFNFSKLEAEQKNYGIHRDDCRSLADNQLCLIQSIIETSRIVNSSVQSKEKLLATAHKDNVTLKNDRSPLKRQALCRENHFKQRYNQSSGIVYNAKRGRIQFINGEPERLHHFSPHSQPHLMISSSSEINKSKSQLTKINSFQTIKSSQLNRPSLEGSFEYPSQQNIYPLDGQPLRLGGLVLDNKSDMDEFRMDIVLSDVNFISHSNVAEDLFDDNFIVPDFDGPDA